MNIPCSNQANNPTHALASCPYILQHLGAERADTIYKQWPDARQVAGLVGHVLRFVRQPLLFSIPIKMQPSQVQPTTTPGGHDWHSLLSSMPSGSPPVPRHTLLQDFHQLL